MKVELADGKFTLYTYPGYLSASSPGFPVRDLTCDPLARAMADEIVRLRGELAKRDIPATENQP